MLFLNRKLKSGEIKKQALRNPKILEVNLIKDEIRISFDWNKNLSVLAVVLFIAGLFLIEIYLGLDWWEKQENLRLQTLSEKIAAVNQEMTKLKSAADEALTYKEKTSEATKLLADHVYWSNFFSWLEKNTLSSVKYGGFEGDLTGKYNLSAKAKSYADISWQVKAFLNSSSTKAATVTSANTGTGGNAGEVSKNPEVDFTLKLEIDPAIFKK